MGYYTNTGAPGAAGTPGALGVNGGAGGAGYAGDSSTNSYSAAVGYAYNKQFGGVGGYGGDGYAGVSGNGNGGAAGGGGAGGNAYSGMSNASAGGYYRVYSGAYAAGGNGGDAGLPGGAYDNTYSGGAGASGGAGGAATATAHATNYDSGYGRAYAGAYAVGGTGGHGIGAGYSGGAGGAVGQSTVPGYAGQTQASASGYKAFAEVMQTGGDGGGGYLFADGGKGGDSTLTNAVTVVTGGGGGYLAQSAYGGNGGFSQFGTGGSGGAASSSLTFNDSTTNPGYEARTLRGDSTAYGGTGGGADSPFSGSPATAGAGGATQASSDITGASNVTAIAAAHGGRGGYGGNHYGYHSGYDYGDAGHYADGGAGGAASAQAAATTTWAAGSYDQARAYAEAVGGDGSAGNGAGHSGGAGGAVYGSTATVTGYAGSARVRQYGGSGGAGFYGASGGAGASSTLSSAATAATTYGSIRLGQYARGGDGGYSAGGIAGQGGAATSDLALGNSAAPLQASYLRGASYAWGGDGGNAKGYVDGAAGGAAEASSWVFGVGPTRAIAHAQGGDGGSAGTRFHGTGGEGGGGTESVASFDNVPTYGSGDSGLSASFNGFTTDSEGTGTGTGSGTGTGTGTGPGPGLGDGGDGADATAWAVARSANYAAYAHAEATGGDGGRGYGAGYKGGDGGTASILGGTYNTPVFATGTSASVYARAFGGNGGAGSYGAAGGAGASTTLNNAVSGATFGGRLYLSQLAQGGYGGSSDGGTGGQGGDGTSLLSFNDVTANVQQANSLRGYSNAFGGGGGGSSYGNGGDGGAATSSVTLTGVSYVYAQSNASGRNGGSANGNGGAGGAGTATSSATSTGGTAKAGATSHGGNGGDASGGAGTYAGDGGVASNTAASAIGQTAIARVHQVGGSGGDAFDGAGGGAGADSSLTDAAYGKTTGGALTLGQYAIGGDGGYSQSGTAGGAGDGFSSLTLADTSGAYRITAYVHGYGGVGGGAASGNTAADGGAGYSQVDIGGTGYLRVNASATGGDGGRGGFRYGGGGYGTGGVGGTATAKVYATSPGNTAIANAHAQAGNGGLGAGIGQAGGAGGSITSDDSPGNTPYGTRAAAFGQSAHASAVQVGGLGGDGRYGASGGAGGSSTLIDGVSGDSSGGYLYLSQTAQGGAGGYSSNGATTAVGGNAISSLGFDDSGPTPSHQLRANSHAYGGRGGSGTTDGSAGGDATASLNLTGAYGVYNSNARAVGGGGGRALAIGTGTSGAGGNATATSDATSTTTGGYSVNGFAYATGGNGGGAYYYSSAHANGGAGGTASGSRGTATEDSAAGGTANAYARDTGGRGGYAGGAGNVGGAGGAVFNTSASASGYSARASVRQYGGNGGRGAYGALGGAGADSTLSNAVSGTTNGGSLSLYQLAQGGAGGYGSGAYGAVGGAATSDFTFDDTQGGTATVHASSVYGHSRANGGASGQVNSSTVGAVGATGGAAEASVNLAGATYVHATAGAYAGAGSRVSSYGSGGDGGAASAHATATSTGDRARANANANGGNGGIASGAGYIAGAGGSASGSTAVASGTSAYAYVTQNGGSGGGGYAGATGGAGADSTLASAVTGSTTGGNLRLGQTANGGFGGSSGAGLGGAAGNATSSLTFNDVTANSDHAISLAGNATATAAAGGGGYVPGSLGTIGGDASATSVITGAYTVSANARATGGNGGANYGNGTGGVGGAANATAAATTMTTGSDAVTGLSYAYGGTGGRVGGTSGTGGAGGAVTGSSASATGTGMTGGRAYSFARSAGGAGGGGQGVGQSGGAGGVASGTTATASGQSVYARAQQIGGGGGRGYTGADGGAGADSTLTAGAVTGTSTGGYVRLWQRAVGGNGGNSAGAQAGSGGAATSDQSFDDLTFNTIAANGLIGISNATGGYGGTGATGGDGGAASATDALTGATAVTANAAASGGNGGVAYAGGGAGGAGGVATAAASATASTGVATAFAQANGGNGGQGTGIGYSGGAGGVASLTTASVSGESGYARATQNGGSGGGGYGGAAGGAGANSTLTNAVTGTATDGSLTLKQRAYGGNGGDNTVGTPGVGGAATSDLGFTDSAAHTGGLYSDSRATGGYGGTSRVGSSQNGAVGGGASATLTLSGTHNIGYARAVARGGHGGTVGGNITGGVGGAAVATAQVASSTTGTDSVNGGAYAYGGAGGNHYAGSGDGGAGGAVTGVSASASSPGATAGRAYGYARAVGGVGGSGLGAGSSGGAGGVASLTTASASGHSAVARVRQYGGSGGSGFNGGAGADSSLTDAVSGTTTGGYLTLRQTAGAGAGGNATTGGIAGAAGNARSSLTLTDSTASTQYGLSDAGGGAGGAGYGVNDGAAGGSATAAIALTGAHSINQARAVAAGGAGGATFGTGNAGGGGSASADGTANGTTTGSDSVNGWALAYGGAGGRVNGTSGSGGAGGAVVHASGTAISTDATGGRAYGYVHAVGGAGGRGFGSGQSGGAGGAVSGSTAYGSGNSAVATVVQTGGAGGNAYTGAAGGAGASSTLTDEVSGRSKGGYVTLRQTATGGSGGYSQSGGATGVGGAATSDLTFNDVTANPVQAANLYARLIATGGTGGGGALGSSGAAGGAAATRLTITGAHGISAHTESVSVGGSGGYAHGTGDGGVGGAASGYVTSYSTTTGGDSVNGWAYATGGTGGTANNGNGGAGGAATGADGIADSPNAMGGRAYGYTRQIGGTGGNASGAGYIAGAGGVASNTKGEATGFNSLVIIRQIGGAGGFGFSGAAGGAGADSTVTDGVTGNGKGGYLHLQQFVTGGAGGGSNSAAAAGQGGAAVSSFTFNDTTNAVAAGNTNGTSQATGGAGGSGVLAGVGGAATASLDLTATHAVIAGATATGGAGGSGAAAGGAASATADAKAVGTDGGDTATANATATGGSGTPVGVASAAATAETASGQLAAANASATDAGGTAQTTAITHASGIAGTVSASATADVDGTATTRSTAADATGLPGFNGGSNNAYAFADDAPDAGSVASALSGHSNVNTAFGASAAVVFGAASQGAFYANGASGAQEYTSSIDWTVNGADVTGHLIIGLLDNQVLGSGFSSLEFSVVVGGVTDIDQTFTSVSDATAYFSNHALDLGAVSATPDLSVVVNFDLIASDSGAGFGEDFLIGSSDSHPPPAISVPGAQLVQQGQNSPISGISVAEPDPLTAGQTITVTLTDTNGNLFVGGPAGASGEGTNSLSITGSVADVNADLSTLTDNDGSLSGDTITVNAHDTRGGAATQQTIAVTVNAPPVITVPVDQVLQQSQTTAIPGLSIGDADAISAGETLTVTLSDGAGTLSLTGSGVTGNNSTSVTVTGSLSQVNSVLSTLTDDDGSFGTDTVFVSASDSRGGTANSSFAVTVKGPPVISAPPSVTIGQNQPAGIPVSLSEAGALSGETFTVVVSDSHGVLSATGAGVSGNNSGSLTITGLLGDVQGALSTLTDTDGSTAADSISITASDSYGATASPASIAVTVASPPVIAAPASAVIAQGQSTLVPGVSVSETNASPGEGFTVTVIDSVGLLSASGPGVSGNGSHSLTISGVLADVNSDLASLKDSESSTTPDSIVVTATDSFGNSAAQQTIAVSVAAGPAILAPASVTVGEGQPSPVNGVSIVESGAAADEQFTVILTDSHGLLSATGAGVSGNNSGSLTITGLLGDVNAELATLTDTDASTAPDSIVVNASDSFGNSAGQQTIAVTVASPPAITTPAAVTVGDGQSSPVDGISISETNATPNEQFTVTVTDTHGSLSATGAGVSGNNSDSLTITGLLDEVNGELATLRDTDASTASDSIVVNVTDGFGNSATQQSIGVTVASPPTITAPAAVTVGQGQPSPVNGVSISETNAGANELFTVTVTDSHGLLSASGASGNNTGSLTITGLLSQVNADLASLTDTDGSTAADSIVVNVTDGFGNTATQQSVAVTVASPPAITAPAAVTVGQGQPSAVNGVSITEANAAADEQFTVTLTDTHGLLSATGAGVSGNNTDSLTITGLLADVNAELATLRDTDASAASDSIVVNATDGFGNVAATSSIAVTVAAGAVITAPAAVTVGEDQPTAIAGVSIAETNAAADEIFTVTVSDTHGLLSATGAGVSGNNSGSLTITGLLGDVNGELATLRDTDASTASDSIVVTATDGFGNVGSPKTIAVTVAQPPVITAPASATVGEGQPAAIAGVSIAETNAAAGEIFTVTVSDTHGLLSATGAGVSGNNSGSLTITGLLGDVNIELATLTDTDASTASDSIVVTATDSFGNSATQKTVAVTVASPPAISAPAAVTVGEGQPSPVGGVSLSETNAAANEQFTVTVTDTNGLLSAAGVGVSGSNSASLTITGLLSQVNADLATLRDSDASTAPDSIVVTATDSFGNSATQQTIAVTVASPPAIAAPAAVTIGQNQPAAIAGVSVSETNAASDEIFTVTVNDSHGLLSATGAGVSGNNSGSLTITGLLGDVNADLASLTDTDASTASDSIVVNVTDGFGNSAAQQSIAVTVASPPAIAAPAAVTIGQNQPAAIAGVSVSETNASADEIFTVTLSDSHGLLSATGAGVSGNNSGSLTITGLLGDVNTDLASLTDTDASSASDSIVVNVTDGFGNSATQQSIAVTVASPPVIAAPATAIIAQGQPTTIGGVSVSETNATANEIFTVTVTDSQGVLSATGADVSGSGSTSLTITGLLGDVNSELATLTDNDASSAPDSIVVTATDSFGNSAAQQTIAVTVTTGPAILAPAAVTVGQNQPTGVSGISIVESGAAADETFTVTVTDTDGVLSATDAVVSDGGHSLTITGLLGDVNSDLATLSDTDASASSDSIVINASDSFGNNAAQQTVAVTVAQPPVITVPAAVTVGQGQASPVGGVSVSETNAAANETYTVTVSDTNGVLSATGAVVSGGGHSLTITGLLGDVNADLVTLSDTDASVSSDSIVVNVTDSFGNSATQQTVAVTVARPPVIAAPGAVTVGQGQASPIAGVSVSETNATGNETYTVTVTDSAGMLSATGAVVSGGGHSLTITGLLGDVNADLATLSDTDASAASDSLVVTATDSFGNSATQQTIAVTVAQPPVITAPAAVTVGQGQATAVGGVSVAETNAAANETYTVTVSDADGVLSAAGAVVSGGGHSLTITGLLGDVNADLATLRDTDASAASDSIVVTATDSFGNSATQQTVAVTVAQPPVITAPAAVTVGQGQASPVGGVSVAETDAAANETYTVTVSDADGVLSATGAVVSGGGHSLTITGLLGDVNADLATLSDTDASSASDGIVVNVTDSFGNAAAKQTIAVTVAQSPVIIAPGAVTVGQGQASPVAGVSVSETNAAVDETYTVTVSDTNGVLSAAGAVVSGGGHSLTITGLLGDVNADLATLSDTDASTTSDSIVVTATDSFGNSAAQQTIAVTVAQPPVITAPGAVTVGQGQASPVAGVSVSETNAAADETYTVTVTDADGVLSAAGAVVSGGGHSLTIAGLLGDVNSDLATLSDTDASAASDSIVVNVTDSFGNAAAQQTIAVTVAQPPVITAPAAITVGQGQPASIAGVSVSETNAAANETYTVTVSDTNGVLSATGAVVSGGGHSLTITGLLGDVNADLATLGDTDGTAGGDTITLTATDSFGNSAATATIAVTANGPPVITAPTTATVAQGQGTSISGVSLDETGTTGGETFTVTLTDGDGLLSATGVGVSGNNSGSLTITGSLAQVNADLATLSDNDPTTPSDTITLNASDSLGNTAATKTISVSVTPSGPASAVVFDDLTPGVGTVSQSGTAETVNLGTITQGSAAQTVALDVRNAFGGAGSLINGTLSIAGSTPTAFINSGFGPVGPLGSQQVFTALDLTLNTNVAGSFSETITLTPTAAPGSGPVGAPLAPITLTLTGIIAPPAGHAYTLTTGVDTVAGIGGGNVVEATGSTLSSGDAIDAGGGGGNTLTLQGSGNFDMRAPATLTDIQTVNAQEAQPSYISNGRSFTSGSQTVYLRAGLDVTVNVASATLNPGNPKAASIGIIGATNHDVINLGSGNDSVTMGAGEMLHGGSGNNVISVTASTITDSIDGGTGISTLAVTGGGAMSMATVTGISAVTLGLASTPYQFLANSQAGLTITDNSTTVDTITAAGANQILTGGAAGKLTMVGASNTIFKDTATLLNGDAIQNFAIGDLIDITGLGFTAIGTGVGQTSISFTENGINTAGTLAVFVGGVQKTAMTLTGVYDQTKFTIGSDGGTGTALGYHS